MNCEHYLYFTDHFAKFRLAKSMGADSIESTGRPFSMFEHNIQQALDVCHIFEVQDEVKDFLAMSKVPKDNSWLRLPFPVIFLDVKFTREDFERYGIKRIKKTDEVVGIVVRKGYVYKQEAEETFQKMSNKEINQYLMKEEKLDRKKDGVAKVGEGLRISILSNFNVGKPDQQIWFDTFNKSTRLYEDINVHHIEVKNSEKTVKKFIHNFILSFLNFCNTKDVEFIKITRSDANRKRRIKKGLIPIPSSHVVKVSGTIKRYISNFTYTSKRSYGYQFDVMGHWRHLMSDKFKKKQGQVIYIEPFKKGKGIYVKKVYQVEK